MSQYDSMVTSLPLAADAMGTESAGGKDENFGVPAPPPPKFLPPAGFRAAMKRNSSAMQEQNSVTSQEQNSVTSQKQNAATSQEQNAATSQDVDPSKMREASQEPVYLPFDPTQYSSGPVWHSQVASRTGCSVGIGIVDRQKFSRALDANQPQNATPIFAKSDTRADEKEADRYLMPMSASAAPAEKLPEGRFRGRGKISSAQSLKFSHDSSKMLSQKSLHRAPPMAPFQPPMAPPGQPMAPLGPPMAPLGPPMAPFQPPMAPLEPPKPVPQEFPPGSTSAGECIPDKFALQPMPMEQQRTGVQLSHRMRSLLHKTRDGVGYLAKKQSHIPTTENRFTTVANENLELDPDEAKNCGLALDSEEVIYCCDENDEEIENDGEVDDIVAVEPPKVRIMLRSAEASNILNKLWSLSENLTSWEKITEVIQKVVADKINLSKVFSRLTEAGILSLGTQAAFQIARLLISGLVLMIFCQYEKVPNFSDGEIIRSMLKKATIEEIGLNSKIFEAISKYSLVWRQLELGPNLVQVVWNILANF